MPAGFLRHVEPWRASFSPEQLPQWNPLMYDSVGQFYPWRKFSADTVHSGYLPLWNPYQFCGTPFIANSQSAVFYPGNALFYMLPTAIAAGWTAYLHLILASCFMYLFVRGLGTSETAAALAGIVFAFSTWEISWLHLPTFLATSCWLPLILHQTRGLFSRPALPAAAALSASVGCCLVAGHLQIAFYVLLAAGLGAVYLAFGSNRASGIRIVMAPIFLWLAAVALGVMLAAVQIVPTLELSRQSHRVGAPTPAGYRAYTDYAVSAGGLAALFVPDFFNNPSSPNAQYFGTSKGGKLFNYAEGAMYVGLLPLLLAAFALFKRRSSNLMPFLGIVALLAFLMALGTAVDAVLYFYVPGFGQSGSPGRALILWTFGIAALSGIGFHAVTKSAKPEPRFAVLTIAVLAVAAAISIFLGVKAKDLFPGVDWDPGYRRQAAMSVLSCSMLVLLARKTLRENWRAPLAIAVVAADLVSTGLAYNPTSPSKEVYPSTPLTEYLKINSGHDRIAPINQNWRMNGPKAVFPPNGAMAFGLRDIQGYDSLFPGQYKSFMDRLARPGADSSPLEVGNMVFAKNPEALLSASAGVRLVLSRDPLEVPGARESYLDQVHVYEMPNAKGRAHLEPQGANGSTISWQRDGATRIELTVSSPIPAKLHLADQLYAGWSAEEDGRNVRIERDNDIFRAVRIPAGSHAVSFTYKPVSFTFGLFMSLCAAAVVTFVFTVTIRRGALNAVPAV